MTLLRTLPGASRAYITITRGHGCRVRLDRARVGTVLLTWWLVAVLITTPLQCTLHCLLLRWHPGGQHHAPALVPLSDQDGIGVTGAGGALCHAGAPLHHAPTAALQGKPTVLSFLPLVALLPLLVAVVSADAARGPWIAARPSLPASVCVRPRVPPPRPCVP